MLNCFLYAPLEPYKKETHILGLLKNKFTTYFTKQESHLFKK